MPLQHTFFLVSIEIAGLPAACVATTAAFTCSNWASRSGLRLPSKGLAVHLASAITQLAQQLWECCSWQSGCPFARSVIANFAWLFDTHSSGRIGSLIVAGSSNWRRVRKQRAIRDGQRMPCCCQVAGAVHTGQRARIIKVPQTTTPIVLRVIPVARAVALILP